MPKGKKKYMNTPTEEFIKELDGIARFVNEVKPGAGTNYDEWIAEYAVIRMYREFEKFVEEILVAAINQDVGTIRTATEVDFPDHLKVEVCRFIVVGDGSLSLRGPDGLIEYLNKYLAPDHPFHEIFKKTEHMVLLKEIVAFRNHAFS